MENIKAFSDAAATLPELKGCFESGLKALGSNSKFLHTANTRALTGSVDLDGCSSIPNTPEYSKRWDYLVGYKTHILAVEIHPGYGENQVKEVIEKAAWLRNWQQGNGKVLNVHATFFYVSSGKVGNIGGSLEKKLALKKIKLKGRKLILNEVIKEF